MEKEKLYEALGELVYAIAMVDGLIQPEEKEALDKILATHPWASTIKWSFEYENQNKPDIETIYNKVLDTCHAFGPSPEYTEFINVIQQVAEASSGIDQNERTMISSFSKDLLERFHRDFDKLNT